MGGGPGSTLMKMLLAAAVMGGLAASVAPRLMDRSGRARAAARSDIRSILSALELYYLDHRAYPAPRRGLRALVAAPGSGERGYLERMPRDPWHNEYQYLCPGARGEVDVFSFGADGKADGSGAAADIGSWSLDG